MIIRGAVYMNNSDNNVSEQFDNIADIYDDNLSELLSKFNVGGYR